VDPGVIYYKISNRLSFFKDTPIRLAFFFVFTLWLSFFHNLGSVPLFDRDEGAFSEATREMFERGDYISTYLNSHPRYDKPILFYWFQAISILLFGLNEFALRFPSAIFTAVWALSIYCFSCRYLDKITARAAFIVMTTSLWIIIIGRAAIADALLNLTITLSLFNIFHYYKRPQKKYIYGSYLWMALGFLTKGPVAIIIASATGLLFFTLKRRLIPWLKFMLDPLGILTFIALAAPWYIIQFLKEGPSFIDGFFFKHNINRYLSSMEGHGGLFFYYLPILLLILLPYSPLFMRTIVFNLKILRLKSKCNDDVNLFLLIWFLFVLVFFSLAGTKLPHYIVYGCTPLFILMARCRNCIRSHFWNLLPVWLFFLVIFFLPEIVNSAYPYINDEYVRATLSKIKIEISVWYRIWSLLSILIVGGLMIYPRKDAWKSVVISAYISVFMVTNLLLPTAGEILQAPIKEAALFVKQNNHEVVMWGLDNPSFSLYREKVTQWREPEMGEIVITRSSWLRRIKAYELLFQKKGIVIARVLEKKDGY
jgi:4-amino-4-deoxy-L-arabinose transferase-like glycosyltransferase